MPHSVSGPVLYFLQIPHPKTIALTYGSLCAKYLADTCTAHRRKPANDKYVYSSQHEPPSQRFLFVLHFPKKLASEGLLSACHLPTAEAWHGTSHRTWRRVATQHKISAQNTRKVVTPHDRPSATARTATQDLCTERREGWLHPTAGPLQQRPPRYKISAQNMGKGGNTP